MERKYGKYEPISEQTKAKIDAIYKEDEKQARDVAYKIAEDSSMIDQNLLFYGAGALNSTYMLRNCKIVPGSKFLSPKIRDFNDEKLEEELTSAIRRGDIKSEIILSSIEKIDGFNKRKNFELDKIDLYRITTGKFAGICLTTGYVTKRDGTVERRLLLDIANTPFEKLPASWQESNFAPFEFAYKLIKTYPNMPMEFYGEAIHVYWLATNEWAMDYNDALATTYQGLTTDEQIKDLDNAHIAQHIYEDVIELVCQMQNKPIPQNIANFESPVPLTEEQCKKFAEEAVEEIRAMIMEQQKDKGESLEA